MKNTFSATWFDFYVSKITQEGDLIHFWTEFPFIDPITGKRESQVLLVSHVEQDYCIEVGNLIQVENIHFDITLSVMVNGVMKAKNHTIDFLQKKTSFYCNEVVNGSCKSCQNQCEICESREFEIMSELNI